MSSDVRHSLEVPNAPKLGTMSLEADEDDDVLSGIPIKLNNFDIEPDFDVEMIYDSQSPTPTQSKDPSSLFTGTDGLRSAFNSPTKRYQYVYEHGSGGSPFYRSPSEKHARLDKGKEKENPRDGKGKGKAVEITYDNEDDDAMTGLATTSSTKPNEGVWESYERYSHSDQQEFNTSSTSKNCSNSRHSK